MLRGLEELRFLLFRGETCGGGGGYGKLESRIGSQLGGPAVFISLELLETASSHKTMNPP